MDTKRLLSHNSFKIIIQLAIAIALILILITANFEFLNLFYLENQQTNTGIIINSVIVGLLVVGMSNILFHLIRYHQQEKAIAGFIDNVESLRKNPILDVDPDSIIVKRFMIMNTIQKVNGEINHSGLAAMLTADESTRLGLVRFINNILILTGVFGTIVSLSVALIGASDLIESATTGLNGMGLVIHGMSTALSTTITAIVSYMVFGYFFMRINNLQTHLLSGIEQLTSVYLMPRFVKPTEDVVSNVDELVKAVSNATNKLHQTQELYLNSAQALSKSISNNQDQVNDLIEEIAGIKHLLRDGFRLPEQE